LLGINFSPFSSFSAFGLVVRHQLKWAIARRQRRPAKGPAKGPTKIAQFGSTKASAQPDMNLISVIYWFRSLGSSGGT
jgi:hypothetical protein